MSTPSPDKPDRSTLALAALLGLGLIVVSVNGGLYALIPHTEGSVLVWWVLTLAFAFGLMPRAIPTLGVAAALAAVAALAIWVALGLLWTESAERTMAELVRVLGFAGLVLIVGTCFPRKAWRAGMAAVSIAAVAVCAIALTSRVAPDVLASPLRSSGLVRRLSYPLHYWNALGCWSAMTVGLTLSWSAHVPSRALRGAALAGTCIAGGVAYLTYSRSAVAGIVLAVVAVVALSRHRWLAAAHAALAALGTLAIVLVIRTQPEIATGTGGRGGAVVGAVALAVVAGAFAGALGVGRLGLERVRLTPERTRRILGATAVVAVFALIGVGPALANRAWHSFTQPTPTLTGDPAHRFGTLGGTRRLLWESALRSFERHPLTGSGAGTFEFTWNRDPARAYTVRDAHSLYLEALGEMGLPGALLIIAVLGSLLAGTMGTALRASDEIAVGAGAGAGAAILVYCVAAGVDWMWESTAVTSLAVAIGTLGATAGAAPAPHLAVRRRAPLAVLALVALLVQLPVLASAVQVRVSQQAFRGGDVEHAVNAATDAIHTAPWSASAYDQRAVVLESLGFKTRAAADARRAADHEPTNWQRWLVLARIEAERRSVKAAIAAARHAESLNPNDPLFTSQSASPPTRRRRR
jgi:O-antigen ligase